MIKLLYPDNGFVFDTHTDVQNEFISRIHKDGIDSATEWLEPVKNGQEISYPRTLTFSWSGESDEYILELSRTPDFADSDSYITTDTSYTLGNLMIGTTYFWRVNGSELRSFSTLGAEPRFVKIDGVPNVRDIGGGKIKQGLLFRGGELERCYTITDEGKDAFVNKLKIKTELDLRADRIGKITSSPAGDGVNLVQLPYRPYAEVFEEVHMQGIVKIMEFLSDESNYPVFFHCLGGADRTGMIALFLRALVGEDDDSIHTDYELTSLSAYAMGIAEGAAATGFRRRTSTYYMNFLDTLKQYAPDEPLSGQVKAFLISCGLDVNVINKIINIIRCEKMDKSYISNIKPHKIYKNLYFVGSTDVSVHIIDTPDGLVMIDTGYPSMYEQILDSIRYLGFDPANIKHIFHSHGHYDHIGGTVRFKKLSGARTYISTIDNDIVKGVLDLSWANEFGVPHLEYFDCDVKVEDGQVFTFGDTTVRCRLCPGHTPGVLSFFITFDDGVVAAMHGGVGMNGMRADILERYGLSFGLRDIFRKGLHDMAHEHVDIVIGNHPEQNGTVKKIARLEAGESIIDTEEWARFLRSVEGSLDALIAREADNK